MGQTQQSHSVVQMDDLVEDVCWRLVSQAHVARVGFVNEDGVQVLPMNYSLLGRIVVFRTSHGSMLDALAEGALVVVEVDQLDDTQQTGWSVIMRGQVERLGPDLLPFIGNSVHAWADGDKDRWFRVRPTTISGRAISHRVEEAGSRLPYMALG